MLNRFPLTVSPSSGFLLLEEAAECAERIVGVLLLLRRGAGRSEAAEL